VALTCSQKGTGEACSRLNTHVFMACVRQRPTCINIPGMDNLNWVCLARLLSREDDAAS
jgi:hypothetical protein